MRMPEGWDNKSKKVSKVVSKKIVTAGGIDMSPEVAGKGLCPACKNLCKECLQIMNRFYVV